MDPELRDRLLQLTHGPYRGTLFDALLNDKIRAYHVVRVGGHVVAWAALGFLADEGVLFLGCYVHPTFRGEGLGKKAVWGLLKKIPESYKSEELHFARGCETLYEPLNRAGFNAFPSYVFLPCERAQDKEERYGLMG